MKILALEFSSEERSVAVVDSSAAATLLGSASARGTRGVKGIALVDEALRQAGIEREQIDCLAVGLGPGSYTGVRSAIVLAQGWQFARGIPIVGVGADECLAEQAFQLGLRGPLNVIVDAQREEFHLARCELGASGWQMRDPWRLAGRPAVQARADAGEHVIGPDARRWIAAARSVNPEAVRVAELASRAREPVPGERLEPIYLREINYVKAPAPRVRADG